MSDEIERYGWSVGDWAKAAGVSTTTVYCLLQDGRLDTVKYSRKRIILTHPKAWLDSLKTAS